ncbi:hypothetical protein CsSME_00008991 [Camellia sinensis var. sinensis]
MGHHESTTANTQASCATSSASVSCVESLMTEIVSSYCNHLYANKPELAARRIEAIGYHVGHQLSERYTMDRPRFSDHLKAIKFICKDFWTELFKKQIDNLKTNHRGFNAAVAGCFFAVESVLWPSPAESSSSLTNATSMVILSAVIASVVSEIGLGSEPAFTVPEYDFRSPSELPLYLLLGVLCGLVSLILSRCTSFMLVTIDNVHKVSGIPKGIFPILGGLAVGLIALAYPEILYWGFENVDILLESRPSVKGLSADLLFQLVAVKIVATSVCRASGLVGGYYAPSLFIGAATGMAYGKFVSSTISLSDPIFHLSFLEVASPQAYGLV